MIEALILVVALGLGGTITGCGKAPQDPAVASFVTEFSQDYQIDVSNIEIKMISDADMAKVLPNAAGVCIGNSVIMIRSSYWMEITDAQRKFEIYHELGHCALHEAHRTDYGADNCPKSIMYPSVMSDYCAISNSNSLIQELGVNRS